MQDQRVELSESELSKGCIFRNIDDCKRGRSFAHKIF